MPRPIYRQDLDDEDDDDPRILRDRGKLTVPMQMMDEKFIIDDRSRLQFFGDHSATSGHRPGFHEPNY